MTTPGGPGYRSYIPYRSPPPMFTTTALAQLPHLAAPTTVTEATSHGYLRVARWTAIAALATLVPVEALGRRIVEGVSDFRKEWDAAKGTPVTPVATVATVAQVAPVATVTPVAPVAPVAPATPVAPVAPVAPATPVAPVAPEAPEAPSSPEKAPVAESGRTATKESAAGPTVSLESLGVRELRKLVVAAGYTLRGVDGKVRSKAAILDLLQR